MRANSILNNLSVGNTVSEIRLLLSADKNRVVMLLEGEDDAKLFKFLVRQSVTLIKAYGASSSIDALLPRFFEAEPRVIAVRDRDYQKYCRHKRIFYCDYSCAEMMVASDDVTFDKVTTNHYRGKLGFDALRMLTLSSLFYISAIRKCSATFHWGLRIGDTDLTQLLGDGVPDLIKTVNFINNYNRHNLIDADRTALVESVQNDGTLTSYLMLTNGHDFVEALTFYCLQNASNSARKQLNAKVMGVSLRLSYSRAAFKKTKLYAALKRYADKNGLIIV